MDLLTIFITGLFVGGLSCLALQGGLLASSLATYPTRRLNSIFLFLLSRLMAYTILGFLLGTLGSVIQLSLSVRALIQMVASLFMIGTALNLLQLHPFFRYFVITPPHFLTRFIKPFRQHPSSFGPVILGAFTVLIPCGATQAMMAYALTTGSGFSGALTLFTFILGTSPLFFALGFMFQRLGTQLNPHLNRLAAIAIILIALYNLSGALALTGFSLNTKPKISTPTPTVTQATIYFTPQGYQTNPSPINVQGGSTVTLKLVNQDGRGCIQAFTIPKLNLQRTVGLGSTTEVTFTTPQISGRLNFMCSMGMYRGVINIL